MNFIFIFTAKNSMKKILPHIALFMMLLCSVAVSAQDNKQAAPSDVLGFYPNPVSNGKIFITSNTSLDKDITIFDVLGKKVLQTTINSKELSIANLLPGVYIIKIREGEATTTRKLIVK
jgi:hypothetical protein